MFIRVVIFATLVLLLSACAPAPEVAAPIPPTVTPTPLETLREEAPQSQACKLEGPIVLGAVESLSGPIAPYGRMIRMGIELAASELNEEAFFGPDVTLEVIFKDDKGQGAVAKKAVQELIEQDKVVGLIGPTLSSAAFEAGPMAQEAKVPMLGTSLTAGGITEMGEYIFRNSLPEADVIPPTINTVKEVLHLRRVALLYMAGDSFTEAGYQVMKEAAEEQGLRVVAEESFAKGDLDFTRQIEKIKQRDVDAILVSALVKEAAAILIQVRQSGLDAVIIGGNGFNSPELITIAGPAAEGTIFGTAWLEGQNSTQSAEFSKAFRAKFGTAPDQFAAQSYSGVLLYGHAIRNACSLQPSEIRGELAKLRLIPTPLGIFSFTSKRNPLHPTTVVMVQDGLFKPFNPQAY